jgi:transposase InsO family protein
VYIPFTHPNKKPEWVKDRVMYLKAHLPQYGCRKIAMQFNQMHADQNISVSKSYVYRLLREHSHEIFRMRKEMRNRLPYAKEKNQLWHMDLTTINRMQILGVMDSGTRALLTLKCLQTKSTIHILRVLLDTVEHYGKPTSIRSDNEAVFTSKLMKFTLWILVIKQQTTQIASPWQNGKIERLFGTMKRTFDDLVFPTVLTLEEGLREFRLFYNHIRPHQHLRYNTPANVWEGKPISTSTTAREIIYYRGLCDNVAGYYFRE